MTQQAQPGQRFQMWCRPWELAEERGLQHYYVAYNGNVNGASCFYHGNEQVAFFAVVEERGLYETFEQRLELIDGNVDWLDNEQEEADLDLLKEHQEFEVAAGKRDEVAITVRLNMTKKLEFGIVRNGEHLERGFDSRDEAQGRVDELKQEIQSFVKVGWITTKQAVTIRFHIVEISRRRSW